MSTSVKSQATPKGQEPPMYLQRPSTGRSQDVRHILARTFRDIYTRDAVRPDTVKNLQVSKGSDDPYHERYVENLQKVYTEWQQRMDEAAMLERHIMQAQARAMSADERQLNKVSQSCESYSNLGLPPVRAHFKSCIDSQLLKDHNLLTPSDYIVQESLTIPAPQGPKIPDYARETLASCQHSRQNSKPESLGAPLAWMPGDSVELPTFVSERDLTPEKSHKPVEQAVKPQAFLKRSGWKEYTSEDQRETDRRALDMLQAKVNYLLNPRHISPSAPPGGKSLVKASKRTPKEIGIEKEPDLIPKDSVVFVPYPSVLEFRNYKVGNVYEITLELKNMSTVMRQCRVLPPTSNNFSVGLGQFPGETGLVAPGMSCHYNIRFAPDSLRDYDDYVTVQTQATKPIMVPLRAWRQPPMLTLPKVLNLGSCLVDGIQATQLMIKNVGGPGRFCLMSRSKWPATSIRTVIPNITKIIIKHPPFDIQPATFELGSDQSTVLEILFTPNAEKIFEREMTIACDNCHASHFTLKGQGEVARVGLAEVERGLSECKLGEFYDISAKNLLRFDDLNPFTYTERVIKVNNYSNVELPFQWMVYKPIMPTYSEVDNERVPHLDSVFSVFPHNGILLPKETAEFKFTFAPPMEDEFHSVVHMMLQHIPPHRETHSKESSRPGTKEGVVETVEEENIGALGVLSFRDIIGVEVEVKGSCIPLNVVLHPYAIFVLAPFLVGSTVKKIFTMANHSYSAITFQWESFTDSYLLEVEPPFGELDPGMALDLELSITGVIPGKINHTLFCYVMNLADPLHLHVQAEFKGPELKIDQPSINFGLVRVGQSDRKEMTIINSSQMTVIFNIVDTPGHSEIKESTDPNDLTMPETSGELKPLGRRTVTIIFSPSCPMSLNRVLQIECEGGESSFIAVYGEAQNPVVCFLECEKKLSDVYLGVPTVFNALLHNKTLLPTFFKWGQVEGSQKDHCVVEIQEMEGEIKSWEQRSVSIAFTPVEAMLFSEVRLPCSIVGQEEELYLNISCDVKTLAVTYKTSTDNNLLSSSDVLSLHFGNGIILGETVRRYVHICNLTAIQAPYSVQVEHFTGISPSPPGADDIDTTRSERRNILSRTPNIADPLSKAPVKAKQDFNKLVLSEKKGVAFLVYPADGYLEPFGEQVIEVTAHSDMWGNYYDNLIFKVGNLAEVKFPMDIKVVGCPLTFQLTAGLPDHKPVVRFGTHISGVNPMSRKLKIINSSQNEIRVDWQVFDEDNNPDKLIDFITCFDRAFPPRDQFGNEIISLEDCVVIESMTKNSVMDSSVSSKDCSGGIQLSKTHNEDMPNIISCFFRGHDGVPSQRPYSIKPPQMVIPGNGCSHIDLTFTPFSTSEVGHEMDCLGYALGYLSQDTQTLDSSKVIRPEAYEADHIKLSFTGHLKPALVTVENTCEEGMTYRVAMSDIVKNDKIGSESLRVCSTMLSNDTLTPLTFRLKVNEPFLLVNLDPANTEHDATQAQQTSYCTLNPRHNLMVKVGFRVSPKLIIENTGELEEMSEDDRKLTFTDQLILQFDNGAEQTVPLFASLAVPQMELSTDIVDFGVCMVGQTREKELFIFNKTSSHSHWTVVAERSPENGDNHEMFQVVPSQGTLEAHITHVSRSKAVLKILFTAKHSEAYRCTFLVQGLLGENSRRLHIMGIGSYDGKHEAVLNV